MRSMYIWTSWRQVSSRAASAAQMSAIVASSLHIRRNDPPSDGLAANSSAMAISEVAMKVEQRLVKQEYTRTRASFEMAATQPFRMTINSRLRNPFR
jgi:hypothetical protein